MDVVLLQEPMKEVPPLRQETVRTTNAAQHRAAATAVIQLRHAAVRRAEVRPLFLRQAGAVLLPSLRVAAVAAVAVHPEVRGARAVADRG